MNNPADLNRILADLYEIDPSLRRHEDALVQLLRSLPGIKPDIQIDHAFVVRLRHQLVRAHMRQAMSSWSAALSPIFLRRPVLMGVGTLAVVVMVVFINLRESSQYLTIAITPVSTQAFGSLAPTQSATPQGGKNAGPNVGFGGGTGVAATAAGGGLGGGTMPSLNGGYPVTKYVYAGEPFTIPETGYAYKNVNNDATGKDLVRTLKQMNFGVNTGSFSDLKVRNLEVVEDKDYGYSINLNVPQGIIAINADWERWHMTEREYNSIPLSDLSSNAALLSIADTFLSEHRINTANYGAPVVDDGWKDMPAVTTLDGKTMPVYAPDAITITYPLMVDGTPVYEGWGAPAGIQVLVDVRERRVQGVNNLSTLGYNRSSYPLETDANIIERLATAGPDASAKLMSADGTQTTVELGTPKLVLMEYYQNVNSHNEKLLIPALRFPLIKQAPGSVSPAAIMVPLVKDIVSSLAPSEIQVKIGEEGSALGVTVKPTGVLEDSRCPMGMMCIQAGTVRVQTMLTAGMGAAPQVFTLNNPVTTETEEIMLVGVSPLKKAGEDIQSADYSFVFDVKKR